MWFISPSSVVTGILVAFGFICFFFITTQHKFRKQAPEAKGRWPIIGHLHLFRGSQNQLFHKKLADMTDKYGPIFTLRLGFQRALIVSNMEMAKECLETNDRVFVDRMKSIALEIMGYNQTMFSFSPYGPYWREMRKIVTVELLSIHRQQQILKPVRESEINSAIALIYNQWVDGRKSSDLEDHKVHVQMKEWFRIINLNIILRVVVGKRLSPKVNGSSDQSEMVTNSNVEDLKELREFFTFVTMSHISDVIPVLRPFDIGGLEKKMKKTAESMDFKLEEWLKEHKRKRNCSEEQISKQQPQDFMDVLLDILEESTNEHLKQQDKDIIIKSTCLTLILGGSDTTTLTLVWALSLLLNNRHALKMAQEELDTHVGRERQVSESDIENLVYLQAIIKETMRLYPAGPILGPRESVEDCNVAGYHVPARTRLLVNLYKLQRDPNVWSNPCNFQPERFLTEHKNVNFKGKCFELIPFGSGRRICPGIAFATQVMHLALARLLHSFEFDTPLGQPVDMTESPGLTVLKATPLEVLIKPRLPGAVILRSE